MNYVEKCVLRSIFFFRITGWVASSFFYFIKMKISYEIRSPEYLATDSGAVIVSNHQSALDMMGE
jgi:1-acyl-sn-glycerol-3-phosphate acyltransferase